MNYIPTEKDFWFLPLGGAGEIGMNLNLFGHDNQWLMVDLGITFHDRLGIEVLTPDPTFIEQYKHLLKGLVVTHAHEDHIGAIPYLWPYLECPIYATPFTAEIIKNKLADKPWGKKVPLHIIPMGGKFSVGSFDIEYITLTHSIPEPTALAITTPLGTVVHTGDWKIDPNPVVGDVTNHQRLIELGDNGVLAIVCDSTNVFTHGTSGSELTVRDNLVDVIAEHPNHRIAVACFASNVARLSSICHAANQAGRKVALVGRSLHKMVEAARTVGYWDPNHIIIDEADIMSYPKKDVLMITTGSQGESRAALSRIASNQHPLVKLETDDVVIFSSRVIPGNEKVIGALQNKLVRRGIRIISAHADDIHVSGHPARDELKQMYAWVRPQIVVPVHGEIRHMEEQARLAAACGFTNSVVPENGSLIQLDVKNPRILDMVHAGRLALDGNSLVPLDADLLKDRSKMAVSGAVFVTLEETLDGVLTRAPHISIIGVLETEEEQKEAANHLARNIRETVSKGFKSESQKIDAIRMVTRQFCNKSYEKKPIVEVHIVKVV